MKPKRITKVTWSEGRTMNVGNFNSVRIEFGMDAELQPGEDADAVQAGLRDMIRETINTEYGAILADRKEASPHKGR